MKKMPRTLYLCLFLLALGVIAGGLLAGVNALTAPIIAENEAKELAKNLEKVGVTNPKEVTTSTMVNKNVTNVYTGKFQSNDCYVFNTTDSNKYTTVNVLVVIEKTEGTILNIHVSGVPSITTHGFDSSFTNENLGVIGGTNADSLTSVSGATISSNSIKTCINAAVEIYQDLDHSGGAIDPAEALKQLLAKANVTNGTKVDKTYESTSIVKNLYEGTYNNEACYVFETSENVVIEEEYSVNFALELLIVLSKENGSVLNTVVVSNQFSSLGTAPTDFGMAGQTDVDNFTGVSGATVSSNVVKTSFEATFNEYAVLVGGAE